MNLIYGIGYDFIDEVVSLGIDFGFIEQAGAWFKYNGDKYQGKDNLVKAFVDDSTMYNEVRTNVKNILGLNGE